MLKRPRPRWVPGALALFARQEMLFIKMKIGFIELRELRQAVGIADLERASVRFDQLSRFERGERARNMNRGKPQRIGHDLARLPCLGYVAEPVVEARQLEQRALPAVPGGKAALQNGERLALQPIARFPNMHRVLWRVRTNLSKRKRFGTPMLQRGLSWYELQELYVEKLRTPLSITFAFVATHNHFVLNRGGKVFNRSAPVIKLPTGASEDEHLGLLGLLNSSLACFWMKQVFHNKGSTVDIKGARQRTDAFEDFYEYTGTGLAGFPIVEACPHDIATRIDTLANQLSAAQPAALFSTTNLPTRASLNAAREQADQLRRLMIASQEELDWRCYRLYGLLQAGIVIEETDFDTSIEVALGERAFEIVLARRVAAGTEQTTWFQRHGATPITEIPFHWPEDYRQVVQRRIDLIERDRNIGLIERPEYKRRWNTPAWDDLERAALRDWLLDRLEAPQLNRPLAKVDQKLFCGLQQTGL